MKAAEEIENDQISDCKDNEIEKLPQFKRG